MLLCAHDRSNRLVKKVTPMVKSMFDTPAAGIITTSLVLVNADANLEYMIPEAAIDGIMADAASWFVKFDRWAKVFAVTENICNGDTIQVVEVSKEWYETVLPVGGRTCVAREIGRRVVSQKVFKFSKKNGGKWK